MFEMLRKKFGQIRYVKNPLQIYRLLTSKIKSIELAINYVCNKCCPGCYARNLRKELKSIFLTPKDVKEICDKYKPAHINVTGGEPTLNPNLVEIIKIIPKSIIVSIVTNGDLLCNIGQVKEINLLNKFKYTRHELYIININKINELKKAGLNTIQLSWGSNYDLSQNELLAETCKKEGLNVCLSVTNIYKERKYIKQAIKLAKIQKYHVLFNTPGVGLEDQFDYQTYFTYRNHPLVREDNMFWNNGFCPAGIQKFYISADKSIYPCDRMLEKKYDSYENMKNEFKKKEKTYCQRYKMMCDEK